MRPACFSGLPVELGEKARVDNVSVFIFLEFGKRLGTGDRWRMSGALFE